MVRKVDFPRFFDEIVMTALDYRLSPVYEWENNYFPKFELCPTH